MSTIGAIRRSLGSVRAEPVEACPGLVEAARSPFDRLRANGLRGRISRRQAGFTLLELLVVIAIVSTLGVVLADRVLGYQEYAEKAAMEQTAGAIRSAMHLQMAALIVRGRESDFSRLAAENPMDWLAARPANYAGAFADPKPDEARPGAWYFDARDRSLVYRVDRGRHFMPGRDGMKQVRFRVVTVVDETAQDRAPGAANKVISGLLFAPAEPYQWLEK